MVIEQQLPAASGWVFCKKSCVYRRKFYTNILFPIQNIPHQIQAPSPMEKRLHEKLPCHADMCQANFKN